MTKNEAKILGRKSYHTGKPCGRGHDSPRQTSNGSCVACQQALTAKWQRSEQGRAWSRTNESDIERRKARAQTPRGKELARARQEKWRVSNPHAKAAQESKRRAVLKQRFPAWADTGAIAVFYQEAARLTAETGVPHEVDHFYPLKGKTVSGLHVETNLRVIPEHQNRTKYNKLEMVEE